MSTAAPDDAVRTRRLHGRFRSILEGKYTIATSKDAELFIEAVQIQQHPDRCVESLISSSHGLEAVRKCVRADVSLNFLQFHSLRLLDYFSHASIVSLADGQLIGRILDAIVLPPTFWNALVAAFLANLLEEKCLKPFAWLAYQLVSSTRDTSHDFLPDITKLIEHGSLSKALSHDIRDLAYKIEKAVKLKLMPMPETGPGGRHDNDYSNFRQISIYPTADEFLSAEKPFYRPRSEVFADGREEAADYDLLSAVHIDNQFRLLREDMLGELRNDLQIALGKRKGKRAAQILSQLEPVGVSYGDERWSKKCSIAIKCCQGLTDLVKLSDEQNRRRFLKENPAYLRNQAFGALVRDNEVCGFAFIDRNVDLLAPDPPVVCLQFVDDKALRRALMVLKNPQGLQFMLVDTPVFAYEPVLRVLQTMTTPPFSASIMASKFEENEDQLSDSLTEVASKLRRLQQTPEGGIRLSSKTAIDKSQLESLLNILERPVSVIQGPPGTGKTFIGTRAVEVIYKRSHYRILVISYTNHALDQSLEGYLDLGIPASDIVRLGSKYTSRTEPLLLFNRNTKFSSSNAHWALVDKLKSERSDMSDTLDTAFNDYCNLSLSFQAIHEYLEFSDESASFYDAFKIPTTKSGGWRKVGKKGKQVKPDYLFNRWILGEDPGAFREQVSKECEFIWDMKTELRREHLARWMKAMTIESSERVAELVHTMDSAQDELDGLSSERKAETLQSVRIIGCTTTAAAMQMKLLRATKPDVVIVEEAGEILESHVLAALMPSVKRLILIGDHKQLRPKVNNYALTVEKGDGFDLNMSLFERLVIQGYPHSTLQRQHRMHPDLSLYPRALTYPNLLDGAQTAMRPAIEGLSDRIIFVNHEHPEATDNHITDRRDAGAKTSKSNKFEATMVLALVRYLAQQGYGTDKMVVLTPYMGQLRLLHDTLIKDNDPVLNDLDLSDLLSAGLMTFAASKVKKRPLRISTIDNYQGEESDIVIASLTRSNSQGEIGFMAAQERLNVLITRARNCLIMIGNMDTFMNSRKGKATWVPYLELMKENGHLYDGFPVVCVRHPETKAVLKTPGDFDRYCPDGGCAELCDLPFYCGLHKCKRRCHRLADHSQTDCTQLVEEICARQHKRRIPCGKRKSTCEKCLEEDLEAERRAKRDLDLERSRRNRQSEYRQQLQDIQDQVAHERRVMQELLDEKKDREELEKKAESLQQLRKSVKQARENWAAVQSAASSGSAKEASGGSEPVSFANDSPSQTRDDWEYLKNTEGAQSPPLDELMGMIGLEKVKQAFMDIKNRVDTNVRQNVSLQKQRYSAVMLGNPGTGKTTVARLYAKFLASIGVIPGIKFEETTGAKLANMGVSGCQKLLDDMLDDGGGVMFIDEAIAFVLAGYNKNMESFFAHNPGLPSRFPYEIKFADYTDDELLHILGLKINTQYNGTMVCEDGLYGLYCRIVAKRLGRGRGKEGFGNARAVENSLAIIAQRQATRLARERRQGHKPDDLYLTWEDLIGPKPSEALNRSSGWQDMQKLCGIHSVKEAVRSLVDSIQQNYQRELDEQPPIEYSLNKVFLGNPGTGKTTVAKLYGRILVDLGLLTKGEALGQSEEKTKGILAATVGKVLVIDEAYGLYSGSAQDPYKTAVVDTIVAEVQSVPGDDRCVLLLGYKDQMEDMFQNVNPGLSRRFPIASAFSFEDFSNQELRMILDLKLKQQGFGATDQAKNVALEMLDRARNRPNFGNAGEIDLILDATKARHQSRYTKGLAKSATMLEALDFDEDFDRSTRSETNIAKLFEGTVGCEDIVAKLEGYQSTVRTMKELGEDPKESIPFNFLFRGPPGTGKTTTAKKMGKVFYDMGFLATANVVECSATDLIGEYVGQTGPRVLKLLDKALGRVLFIDEAYRLGEGHFSKEAMDELVDSATKDRYYKKLVIILAGYTDDINRLMSTNAGLSSRFPEVIDFRSLSPPECMDLLKSQFATKKSSLELKGITIDLTSLDLPAPDFSAAVMGMFATIANQPNWANARDVLTIAKKTFERTTRDKAGLAAKRLVIRPEDMLLELEVFSSERASRATSTAVTGGLAGGVLARDIQYMQAPPAHQHMFKTTTATKVATAFPTITTEEPGAEEGQDQPAALKAAPLISPDDRSASSGLYAKRDAGVSDAVWEQLQRDKREEVRREAEYQSLKKQAEEARDADRDAIVTRLLGEEDRRKKQLALKEKLARLGICPVGYAWISQSDGGYRCAGGSHYLSKGQFEGL
ncbi:hypothetical protein MCOR28_011007 [Pyricularia oryzae]|nr:hypothetical protein MCOR26_011326 [Pyricularia oryzae]KAI6332160.1 hypothetical protein MCOR28_011007 [Pyricularia oryzae]